MKGNMVSLPAQSLASAVKKFHISVSSNLCSHRFGRLVPLPQSIRLHFTISEISVCVCVILVLASWIFHKARDAFWGNALASLGQCSNSRCFGCFHGR